MGPSCVGALPAICPQPGDTVFEAGRDASLFIAEDAGDMLDDKIMDAHTEADGRVRFVLDTVAVGRPFGCARAAYEPARSRRTGSGPIELVLIGPRKDRMPLGRKVE